MKWYCKTCGHDMTQGVREFMGEKRVAILVCPKGHASRFHYKDGVGEEK